VFGNLLDPGNRNPLGARNKRVFVLKEELGTKPQLLLLLRQVNP
jgi:hypothetical protein